jgi:hypothetical protein
MRGLRGRDGVVDEFKPTNVISVYHQQRCEFQSRSWRDVLNTTLCDKVFQRVATGFRCVFRFPPPIKLTTRI